MELAANIVCGETSAAWPFDAHTKKATMAHQLTNRTKELFKDKILDRVQKLGKCFFENAKAMGRFHGLPVSIKEPYDQDSRISHTG